MRTPLALILACLPAVLSAQIDFEPFLGPFPAGFTPVRTMLAGDTAGNYYLASNSNMSSNALLAHSTDGEHWVLREYATNRRYVVGHNGGLYAYAGTQLWQSTDHGQSWTLISSTFPGGNELEVDLEGRFFLKSGTTVHRSMDNGLSWQQVFQSSPDSASCRLHLVYLPESGRAWLLESPDVETLRLWRASDDGLEWDSVYSITGPGGMFCNQQLQAGPDGTLYLNAPGSEKRLAVSTDGGDTWSAHTITPISSPGSILFSPLSTPGHVVVQMNTTYWYCTQDYGQTWTQIIPAKKENILRLHRMRDGTIFGQTNNFYRLANEQTLEWNFAGYGLTPVYPVWIDSTHFVSNAYEGIIVGTAQSQSFLSYIDYLDLLNSCAGPQAKVDASGRIYVRDCHTLLRTADQGQSYDTLFHLAEDALPAEEHFTGFEIGPNGRLYVLTEGHLYRSTDDGQNWLPNSGLTGGLSFYFSRLSVAPSGRVYVLENTGSASVLRSDDGGATLQPVPGGGCCYGVVPGQEDRYCLTPPTSSYPRQIVVSQDYGETCAPVGVDPFPAASLSGFNTLRLTSSGLLIAGASWNEQPAVLISNDGGQDWTATLVGAGQNGSASAEIGPDGHLYVGVGGLVAQRTLRSTLPLSQIVGLPHPPERPTLELFPNPGTGTFRIAWPEGGRRLFVYDRFGRIVWEQAADDSLEQVSLPASLADGLYFVEVWNEQDRPVGQGRMFVRRD